MNKTFKIFTLGCKVNTYESNALKRLMIDNGYIELHDDTIADVVILNTCSVTSVSDQKSRQHIRKLIKLNPGCCMVVMGCYSQMSANFVSTIEGVSIVVGTNNRHLIPELIEKFLASKKVINIVESNKRDFDFENDLSIRQFSETRAFIKIQDGCNNFCSYCIIPYARGRMRSRSKEKILNEVRELTVNGYKEIVLTGIHTGGYGLDFENNYHLYDLLKDIISVEPKVTRLRISSIEQGEINENIINLLSENNIIANHLHIPLQSGCDSTLKRMNRKYDTKMFYDKLCMIRQKRPDIAITTDVIVGFPGETEEEFNSTYEFIKKCNFSELHVFPYSARQGTLAAKMENQIDPSIKKERVRKLIELSSQLQNKYQASFIGKEVDVLFEEYDQDTDSFKGHTSNYIMVHEKSKENLCNCYKKIIYKG
ncbi:MAG: tRNA (N(6)-L-threonylcarbamoyladenosine(37)-C(2))-methylthiotransferase MtaB [Bacilli bacterium]|nr:tRNA (N(6)-L-threonylcarbamoyladenosine(37)-C(2))-methylthiotransferase MtaB [Bacilli bacterium]